MKFFSSIINGVIAVAFFATPMGVVYAQDEKGEDLKPIPTVEINDVNLNISEVSDKAMGQKGFFFFNNDEETPEVFEIIPTKDDKSGWSLKGDTSFTPRSGSSLEGFGDLDSFNGTNSLGGFTPRNADTELVLSYRQGYSLEPILYMHYSS